MKYPPYRSYKSSGVEWLDSIPSHWEVRRLKFFASAATSNVDKHTREHETPIQLCNYLDVYNNEYISSDFKFMHASADETEISKFSLKRGDILITKDGESWEDIAVPALVRDDLDKVLCGYHLAIVRSLPDVFDPEFLFRLFCFDAINYQFRVSANGVTRFGLSSSAIDDAWLIRPPLVEQKAIAQFIHIKTAQIDSLIERRKRLLELLEEKQLAIVTHALTEGLDASTPKRKVNIEWLREIPKHWELLPLTRVVRQFVDYRGATPTKVEEGVPLITATQIKNGRINHGLDPVFISEEEYAERMTRGFPERGDVLARSTDNFNEARY